MIGMQIYIDEDINNNKKSMSMTFDIAIFGWLTIFGDEHGDVIVSLHNVHNHVLQAIWKHIIFWHWSLQEKIQLVSDIAGHIKKGPKSNGFVLMARGARVLKALYCHLEAHIH